MQYLLMIWDDEKTWEGMPKETQDAMLGEYIQLTRDLKTGGQLVAADALQRVHTATTVRVRDGKTTSMDGPFAETREQLGGYYLIEAKDLDEAVKIAARIPSARHGAIEIRPIQTYPRAPS